MRNSKFALVLIITLMLSSICSGQSPYISHYILKDHIKSDTLIDKKSYVKFIIDKERIFITAIDSLGKILWKTDPYTDNKIREYRVKRPTIVYFAFSKDFEDAIAITYNNTQFGYIEKTTGEYDWHGQD
jgi:hypothetical protein